MLAARWVSAALFVLAVPVFLVLSNVRLAAMEPRVYGYSFAHYDVEEVTGIDRAQLDYAARDIVYYFRDDRSLLDTRVVVNEEEQPLFTPREALHMRDVKQLFQRVFRVHEIAFAYIVAYVAAVFLWSRERSLQRLARQLVVAGAATGVLLAVAALATVVGFDSLFRQFHLLSFSNDFWQLDPERDRLIQMFPRGFWFDVTLAAGIAAIFEGGLVALAGYGLRRWLERRSAARMRTAPAPSAAP